ncbi:MAG: polysaccharide deacetylase family protein, partial [Candidatus Brocadiales bacterium]
FVALSLDVDPDSNRAVRGRIDSLSPPPEKGLARIDLAHKGLMETLRLLKYLKIPATLFFEARTAQMLTEREPNLSALTSAHEIGCHSHRHEDFLGTTTGIPIPRAQAKDIIRGSMDILDGIFSRRITGFRAPYLRINQDLLSLLGEMGFTYDSSVISDCIRPFYMKQASLWELAVASLRADSGRRVTSYLHPVFEGKRDVKEYVWAVGSIAHRIKDGLFIIAFHPWELFVTPSGKTLSGEDSRRRVGVVTDVLQGLKETPGLEFIRLDQYLTHYKGHPPRRTRPVTVSTDT